MTEHQEQEPMERPSSSLMALTFGDTRGPVDLADITWSLDPYELTRRVMALTAENESLRLRLSMIEMQMRGAA